MSNFTSERKIGPIFAFYGDFRLDAKIGDLAHSFFEFVKLRDFCERVRLRARIRVRGANFFRRQVAELKKSAKTVETGVFSAREVAPKNRRIAP